MEWLLILKDKENMSLTLKEKKPYKNERGREWGRDQQQKELQRNTVGRYSDVIM